MSNAFHFENREDGDTEDFEVERVKVNAKRRKGRGFQDLSTRSNIENYESLAHSDGVGAQRSVEGWILFVTGVHEEATEDNVRDIFADIGQVKNMHLNMDRRTGFYKGYAMVEYETYSEARRAIEKLNNSELLGLRISVDWAFVKGPQRRKYDKDRRLSPR